MLLFILVCLLSLVGLSTSANDSTKLSSTATVVPQPSQTVTVSESSVAPSTGLPTLPTLPVEPTTIDTLPPPSIPTGPSMPLSGDFVVQYYGKKISMQDLLVKVNMTSAPFDVGNLCPSLSYSCESVCPLANDARERTAERPCYCDELCVELGDCCYDYFSRCVPGRLGKPQEQHSGQKCIKTTSEKDHYGYVMIGRCPSNRDNDKNLESLCTATASTNDLFKMLPVSDLDNNIVYKNVFCAGCNGASNQAYWKFSASCENLEAHDLPSNRSLMLHFVINNCKWSFKEPHDKYQDLKRCLAVEKSCPDSMLGKKEPLLPKMCSFYAFPVCNDVRKKNPHCEVCHGIDISAYHCSCLMPPALTGIPGPETIIPSLDILFDFSSSSSHSVKVGDETTVVDNKACSDGFLFDPFAETCAQIHKLTVPVNETSITLNCSGSGFVKINTRFATLFPNGSIWIFSQKRIYNNGSYLFNGSSLLICMNLTQNYTETTKLISRDTKITVRQIITYIGCAISMISLIFLLAIYITFGELRTLPGKNLMCLSCAMLLYHTVFLMTGQSNRPHLCTTVSVLLHYFLLSLFCWMSVMAFDVAKTFGTKAGQTARYKSTGSSKAALVKYNIFAWITPAVIVTTVVILDKTHTVFIGYGEKICWISNGKALLLVLGVPAAVILVFNFVALSFTMVSIWKVQKSTRRVADQSQQTSLPVLYIKLSSALGFTWVLGFVVPFVKVEFLTYLFVIFNSLQGFFIFLAFVANKRTVNKVKGAWSRLPKSTSLLNTNSNIGHGKTKTTMV